MRTGAAPSYARHQAADPTGAQSSKNALRCDMLQLVLRETMRRHGIPSSWIECRTMSLIGHGARAGLHVQLIVRQGHGRLLTCIPAFQSGFLAGIEQFEPRAAEWLFSLSWQFEAMSSQNYPAAPDPASGTGMPGAMTAPAPSEEDEVQEDLKALLAIRDAALQNPVASMPDIDAQDFDTARPGR